MSKPVGFEKQTQNDDEIYCCSKRIKTSTVLEISTTGT